MSNIAFLFLPLAFSSLPAVLPFVSPSSQVLNVRCSAPGPGQTTHRSDGRVTCREATVPGEGRFVPRTSVASKQSERGSERPGGLLELEA